MSRCLSHAGLASLLSCSSRGTSQTTITGRPLTRMREAVLTVEMSDLERSYSGTGLVAVSSALVIRVFTMFEVVASVELYWALVVVVAGVVVQSHLSSSLLHGRRRLMQSRQPSSSLLSFLDRQKCCPQPAHHLIFSIKYLESMCSLTL